MATATYIIPNGVATYIAALFASDTIKLVLGQLSGGASLMDVARNRAQNYGGAGSETGELATANGYTQGGITVSGDSSGTGGTSGSTFRAWYDSGTVTLSVSGGTITIGGILLVNTSRSDLVIGTLDCANGGSGIVCASGTTFRFVPPSANETSGMLRINPAG